MSTIVVACRWCHGAGCLACGQPGRGPIPTGGAGSVCLCGAVEPLGLDWPRCPTCDQPMCPDCEEDEYTANAGNCVACRDMEARS